MKSLKPLLLSFSLLAFTGAYAQDAKKEKDQTQAKPAMSQADSKDDKASGSAAKQSQQSSGASAGASSSTSGAGMAGGMSVKNLRGMDVVDSQGKDLGEIDEVMLDMADGRVHSVVLGFGGFLGLGEKHFAFLVSDLQPAKEKNKLQLNVDKEKLKDREGFAKGKYPAPDDDYWAKVGQGDKSGAAAGATGQKASVMRASKVIGQDVQDKSGQDVGEVKDIVLSSDRTRIQHVVLDVKGAGEATLPPKSLSMGKEGDKLVVDMSSEQLKSQAKPAAGASSGASTTRTVPIERDKQSQADTKPSGSASAGAGSSSAGTSASKKGFAELDRDNDGSLSRMEAAADANAKSNFESLDKNSDKKLSRSEYEGGQGAAAGATGSKQSEQKDKSK
ncbi:MAG TPA: PRC-barrel domain-containing protein [Burkholderiales bacterium]